MKAAAAPAGPRGEALIRLQGVDVAFAGARTPALAGVGLTLRRGDALALVGANGAGKTTLLRVLNGLIEPTAGRREALPRQGRPLAVAMVFQRPFWLHFSARRNLALALWLAGVPRAERAERVAAALARVGLQAQAAQPARSLSGGQQQRLALARAWAVRPDVLFLDEPTASLDPSAKKEVEALIETFSAQGMTLAFSSHNLGQVKRLATRVVFLHQGRVGFDGSPTAFFAPRQEGDEAHAPLPQAARHFLAGELPWV